MTAYKVKVLVETVIEIDDEGIMTSRQFKDSIKDYFVDPCLVANDIEVLSWEGIEND